MTRLVNRLSCTTNGRRWRVNLHYNAFFLTDCTSPGMVVFGR
jgi:hypothetical protein